MTAGALTRPTPTEAPVELRKRPDDLSYREARESPCLACTSSPCCTNLLLASIALDNLMAIDHAVFLLNFEGIFLLLGSKGASAQVYLHQACSFLDEPSGLCTVHSTPLQPPICVHYKSHSCAYRQVFTTDVHAEKPLLDRHRMAWFADRLVFDDDRRVTAVPDWDEMLEAFESMPLDRRPMPPPEPDPVVEEWRSIVLSDKAPAGEVPSMRRHGDREVSDPCQGCGAWCCKTLVFDRGLPGDIDQFEFLRYCLGFPGVEVGVTAGSWAVMVRTTCRHLVDNRCSVFGSDERPLKCGYYDALTCGYRGHFGVPRPDDMVRVRRDQFGVVADSMVFDDLGRVVAVPSVEILRYRLDEAERAAGRAQQFMIMRSSLPRRGAVHVYLRVA